MAPLNPPIPSAAASHYRLVMLAHFPLLVDWGIYNCRDIAGTNTPSQHAWANAVDLHPLTKSYGDKAAAYIQANAGSLHIANLLWQVPDHYDHIHADFNPQGVGTPPCMGGKLQVASNPVGSDIFRGRGGRSGPLSSDPAQQAKDRVPVGLGADVYNAFKAVLKVPEFLGRLPQYLKIAAGGTLMLAGLGVILVGVTGQQNKVAAVATGAYGKLKPTGAPAAPAAQPSRARSATSSTAEAKTVRIGGERVPVERLSPRARAQIGA